MNYTFQIQDSEYWWGGTSTDGIKMPFRKNSDVHNDFRRVSENQTMPMFLSSKGRCIWSETPFEVHFKDGEILIEGDEVTIESFGETLKDAYIGAMNKYFPPSGNALPMDFFEKVQYNTWMQMTYFQTQQGVMDYAEGIIKNGFEPGILMIDEGWQKDYGNWSFDPLKFPDPKGMTDKLHEMGFKVMLWVVPYVRADGLFFINHTLEILENEAYTENLFVRDKDGDILLCHWWNGYSAILDFTKEQDRNFMDKQLKALMNDYGIDGFKFDGGEWSFKARKLPVDMELFVRMAQCSALFPMMQFSWAPWEALDEEHLSYVKDAHDLHIKFAPKISELIKNALETGEPVLRALEYNYPHCGYQDIKDEFMLGDVILVAPVVVKGQRVKTVVFPDGRWTAPDGKVYEGGVHDVPAPLSELLYFIKEK